MKNSKRLKEPKHKFLVSFEIISWVKTELESIVKGVVYLELATRFTLSSTVSGEGTPSLIRLVAFQVKESLPWGEITFMEEEVPPSL